MNRRVIPALTLLTLCAVPALAQNLCSPYGLLTYRLLAPTATISQQPGTGTCTVNGVPTVGCLTAQEYDRNVKPIEELLCKAGIFNALALTGPVTSNGLATAIGNNQITAPMLAFNYAGSSSEGGAATTAETAETGDSATAFFSTGTIEDARIAASIARDSEIPTETELEAILDLQDLQGAVTDGQIPAAIARDAELPTTVAGDVDGAFATTDLDEAAVEGELEAVLDLPDLQGVLTDGQIPAAIARDSELPTDTDDQDADDVPYAPAQVGDWVDPDPVQVAEALDDLGERLTTEEAKADDDVPESGDFGNFPALAGDVDGAPGSNDLDEAAVETELEAVLDHNDLQGYQSDEHVAHGGVTLTAGAGLSGGGTIAASRTFATASQETGFLADGGASSLPCGAGTAGQMQVMDDGKLQFCDGAATPVLRSGFFDADGVDATGSGIGGTLGTTDNVVPRADGTGGATAQDSAIKIEDYVSTSPASDYVSITPFGADSIISTRLNYVGGNGSPGVYGAGILINGTSVGIQASGSYFKTWDGGGGNAPILGGLSISFGGTTSASPMIRATGAVLEGVLADSSNFADATFKKITAKGPFVSTVSTLTIADNGTGTAATGTLTPGTGTSYAEVTCNDANGCDVTMSETSATQGQVVNIVNVSANVANFADTAGVSELPAGGISLGQYDSLDLRYSSDRWIATGRSDN